LLYTPVSGDFVLHARVSMDGRDDYDGAGIMAFSDDGHWIKTCLENTDFGTTAVISVVTNGVSDDANGPNVSERRVWLQIARKGALFAAHYSLDGKQYDMIRICTLPCGETLWAGFVAQAPVGSGGWRWFEHPVIEQRTVEDIRRGR
jgi:regulation of enolase protein 1 (concanavalin A-like superfamily)